MRVNETAGIFHHMEQISPETFQAQRLQELRDVAEWRGRRIAAYKAWSDPKAIAERKAAHEKDAAAALERGQRLAELARAQQQEVKESRPKLQGISVVTVLTPIPRTSWWQRFLAWLKS